MKINDISPSIQSAQKEVNKSDKISDSSLLEEENLQRLTVQTPTLLNFNLQDSVDDICNSN